MALGLTTNRQADHVINENILHRWSPRALSGEPMDDDELMPLFEAARWAPSSYNAQPWRFIIAKRDTSEWEALFALLVEANQSWAKNASCLVVVVSQKNFEHNGKPNRVHSFDAGSAWENLAIETASRGYVAHGMGGFDYEKAQTTLRIPDDYTVEAMIAIGKLGSKEELPDQMKDAEVPSDRKPVTELLFHGTFGVKY